MEEILRKIDALLVISGAPMDISEQMRQQDVLITELKALARANNTLIGRVLRFQYADSDAPYVITKVLKNDVQLTWFNYCDGWEDGRLGKKGKVSLAYALEHTDWEDSMDMVMHSATTAN